MVVWLIGVSGSGKSTLGDLIKEYLDGQRVKNFLIDGDEVRQFFNNDLGYDEQGRRENIKRIILASYYLEKNRIVPIVCNISPFENLREFARHKLRDYNQIFLRKDIQIAQQHDVKGVYQNNMEVSPLVGIDMAFEDPKHSELVINVDCEEKDVSFATIKHFLDAKIKNGI